MKKPLVIDYYTDVLCVWAWIAQRRIDELNQQLGDKIELRYHYVDIFGDVATKMKGWQDNGGYSGFADHVLHSASLFDDAVINPTIWNGVKPTTSANAHIILKAIEIAYDKETSIAFALSLRNAFFVEAMDISNIDLLLKLATDNKLDSTLINTSINNGTAIAALMNDYQSAKQQNIKGSPSYVIDGGRQILYGNVGYRVLLANIEEVLKHPEDEASWC